MKQLLTIVLILLIMGNSLSAQEKTSSSFTGWLITNYRNDFKENGVNSFGFRNIRLIYKGGFNERLSYLMVADMVGTKDKKPMFLQGWLDYAFNDNFSARMGQYKYPFGMEAYPSVMTWKFINPSYATAGIVSKMGRVGASYRDVGMQLSGRFALAGDMSLQTKVMVMNGNGINTADDGGFKDYILHATLELTKGVTSGFSYYRGINQQMGDLSETAWDAYVAIERERFTAKAEYISASYQQASGADITPAGFYVYGTYMFWPGWEGGLRYDTYETDSNLADRDKSRVSLSLGYYLDKLNRVVVNYELLSGSLNENNSNLFMIQFYGVIK